jgi:hypothetical protein
MNRILLLIAIAGLTFVVILFAARPDLLKDFWLWAVGLAGPIVKIVDVVIEKLKAAFTKRMPGQTDKEVAYHAQRAKDINESVG